MDVKVTLVSTQPWQVYSGALPQYLGGYYAWSQTSIDLKKLCSQYGTRFVHDKVTRIDRLRKTVTLASGEVISYSILVINVGAATTPAPDSGSIYPVKPMSRLPELRDKLQHGAIRKLLIAGGGAAGTEIAMNLSHSAHQVKPEITLMEMENRILPAFPPKAARLAERRLQQRGVNILTGAAFSHDLAEGFDAVILATGNRPGSIAIEHTFKTSPSGRLLTDHYLLVSGEDSVFAAGDTADVGGEGLPPVGVHAVRQGVTLRHNIDSLITGRDMKPYKPVSITPLIMSDGPRNAIMVAGSYCLAGKTQSVLKYMLDMHWMEKYTLPGPARRTWLRLMTDGRKRLKRWH
jgi:NADH dehydrogenase FAD-containing subunit